jgi:zinc protease
MTEATVAAIQRPDLVAWHKAHFSPKSSVLLVVSGQKAAQLRPAIERAFGGWRGAAVKASARLAMPSLRGMKIRLVDVPGLNQAHIRVGRTGLAHRDPDFPAATVVNHVLGGNDSASRIGRAARRAFAGRAAASSSFDRNIEPGAFVAAGVAPTPEAVALMRVLIDEITSMASEGPSADEVKAAVTELAGGYQARLESAHEVGGALLAAELHGLGGDYVRDFGVTIGKVNAAAARASAARWLDGKNLVVVLTGNAQVIEPQLMEAGLKFERVTAEVGQRPGPTASKPSNEKPASPKAEQAARAVLDAALTAKGGADKLAAVKTLHWKGKAVLNLPGGQVPAVVEKRFVSPDKLRLDMVIEMGGAKMSITTALDGEIGWAQERRPDGTRVIDFPKSEIEAGKAQIWRDQDFVLLRHREKGARVAPLDDVDLDGNKHHAIRVTSADGRRTVVLLVDKKSKRLAGMTYEEQGLSAEERFGDYKQVDGIQLAQKRSTKSQQVDLTTTITEMKVNAAVDRSIFVKPAGAKKPPAKKPPAGPAPKPPAADPGPKTPPPAGPKPAPGK